jgi:hypothetical protein
MTYEADTAGLVAVLPVLADGWTRPAAANVHGYQTAFWWGAGIIWAAAVICGLLIRPKTRLNAASPEQLDEAAEGGLAS